MGLAGSIISELEDAVQSGSREKRQDTLRRVTDLFLVDADRLNDNQIEIFDEVLLHLTRSIESKALAELGARLAPVNNAPKEVIRRLARDDEIAVAGPVLALSHRLTTGDLVEIANTKSQAHLLAISGRPSVDPIVTDVLVDRGNSDVVGKVVANPGASFSKAGFATLAKRAERDEGLLESLGRRLDMPAHLFRTLLLRATEAVKQRLLSSAAPELQAEVRRVLARVSGDLERETSVGRSREDAQRLVILMHQAQQLDVAAFAEFARADKLEEILAGCSLLCGVPFDLIDHLVLSGRADALLVAFKAAGLDWPTVCAILKMRSFCRSMSEHDIEQARVEYMKLTSSTAHRVLRFWQVRESVSAQADARSGSAPADRQ